MLFARCAALPLLAIVALSGCTVVETNQPAVAGVLKSERMSPRLNYTGFSVSRPAEKDWFLQVAEQTPQRAVFRRKTKSATRIVYFAAALNLLDRAPQGPADFVALVKSTFTADGSMQKPDFKAKLITWQGQMAVEYELNATLASRDGKPRVLRDRGLIVRHPRNAVTTVQMVFSQRGVEGELDKTLDDEGQALLDGVAVLPIP